MKIDPLEEDILLSTNHSTHIYIFSVTSCDQEGRSKKIYIYIHTHLKWLEIS